jgi:Ala-tRNA(Pro) deacylase
MAIAKSLINYLQERGVDYELVAHDHSATSRETARKTQIAAHQVAKAVVLRDEAGYVLGVIPATHSLEIGWVNTELKRDLSMACEEEFKVLFADCEPGAVPALGAAYGIQVIWDDDLKYTADIYIEAGDHEHLIWMDRKSFRQLMKSLPHSIISSDSEVGGWKY